MSQLPRQRKRMPSLVCEVVRITRRSPWDVLPTKAPWWLSWTAPAGGTAQTVAAMVRSPTILGRFRIALSGTNT